MNNPAGWLHEAVMQTDGLIQRRNTHFSGLGGWVSTGTEWVDLGIPEYTGTRLSRLEREEMALAQLAVDCVRKDSSYEYRLKPEVKDD